MPVLAVDKPLHLTSHDVVAKVRRARQTKRVGHTGTLDPLATGVLVLCIDESTKLVQFMEADSKDYLAWVALGAASPTLDAEGPLEEVVPVPAQTKEQWQALLAGFVGPQKQVPPQYSAIQVGGQRAYAVARAGGHLDLPARDIMIHSLEFLAAGPLSGLPRTFDLQTWSPAQGADPLGHTFELPPPLGEFPGLLVRASVGSGTYIRSLARDIGAALGVPAHLAGLVRTRVGKYDLRDAVSLPDVAEAVGLPDVAALDFPVLHATEQLAKELRQGKKPAHSAQGRHVVLLGDELVAVVDGNGESLRVVRAWRGNG